MGRALRPDLEPVPAPPAVPDHTSPADPVRPGPEVGAEPDAGPPSPLVRRRRRPGAVVVLLGALLLVVGVAASQWVFGWFSPTGDGGFSTLYAPPGTLIARRACPSLACADVTEWNPGTRVRMTCYRDAEWASLNDRSNRWFSVDEPQSGRTGWVHSSQVGAQTHVSAC